MNLDDIIRNYSQTLINSGNTLDELKAKIHQNSIVNIGYGVSSIIPAIHNTFSTSANTIYGNLLGISSRYDANDFVNGTTPIGKIVLHSLIADYYLFNTNSIYTDHYRKDDFLVKLNNYIDKFDFSRFHVNSLDFEFSKLSSYLYNIGTRLENYKFFSTFTGSEITITNQGYLYKHKYTGETVYTSNLLFVEDERYIKYAVFQKTIQCEKIKDYIDYKKINKSINIQDIGTLHDTLNSLIEDLRQEILQTFKYLEENNLQIDNISNNFSIQRVKTYPYPETVITAPDTDKIVHISIQKYNRSYGNYKYEKMNLDFVIKSNELLENLTTSVYLADTDFLTKLKYLNNLVLLKEEISKQNTYEQKQNEEII